MKKRQGQKQKGRDIPEPTKLILYGATAGRCERFGCNSILFRHPLTKSEGNFAQIAHNLPVSKGGPRTIDGRVKVINKSLTSKDIHSFQNLLLLCYSCHREVDRNPTKFPEETLQDWKNKHESRILTMTGDIPVNLKTTILQFRARTATAIAPTNDSQAREAISPMFQEGDMVSINLNSLPAIQDGNALKTAIASIDEILNPLMAPASKVQHLSVFAVGPIPLLIHLGSRLSDKMPIAIYQLHRLTNWNWRKRSSRVKYRHEVIQTGKDKKKVALVLSLSGKITKDMLPYPIKNAYNILEITLDGQNLKRTFLRRKEDLEAFRDIYLEVMDKIRSGYGPRVIHLFVAAPASVAVTCGHELMRPDPPLLVYDWSETEQTYTNQLTVTKA